MVRVRHVSLDGHCSNGTPPRNNHTPPSTPKKNKQIVDQDSPDELIKHAAFEKIQENSQKIKSHLVEHAVGLTDMLEELLNNVDGYLQMEGEATTDQKTDERKPGQKLELQDKEFLLRDSLLTELFQISHIQSIYHIFVAGLVLLFLQTCLYDYFETGWIRMDFGMISYAFGKLQTVITVWLYMQCAVLVIFFPAFQYWANSRQHFLKTIGTVDSMFVSFLFLFFTLFMYLPVSIVLSENLPPASSTIIMCEQVRFAMKCYAFTRTNWPRVTNFEAPKDGKEGPSSPCPDFGNFLYFLFVPTLIYRDNYPRTSEIRWSFVASNFIQVIACLFYTYYVIGRFCVPVFRRYGKEPFGFQSLLLSVFGCMMPGTLALLIQFYMVLHCWMNAFAEMLRFGDRLFYKDWWNSKNYANYYRTWNVVIHDWLYTYVYKDIYQICKPNRQIPMLAVFFLSVVVHEYLVSLMFHFFYPILLLFFGGFGVFFVFLTKSGKSRFWNIFFWVTFIMGPGFLMTLYCLEIYARENCPPTQNPFVDFFIPRSWFCSSHEKEVT